MISVADLNINCRRMGRGNYVSGIVGVITLLVILLVQFETLKINDVENIFEHV